MTSNNGLDAGRVSRFGMEVEEAKAVAFFTSFPSEYFKAVENDRNLPVHFSLDNDDKGMHCEGTDCR